MSSLEQNDSESMIIQACRACLDTKMVNYIQIDSEDDLWTKLYQFCTGLSVRPQFGSQLLCIKCTTLIKSYAEFKKQCLKSEEFWCSLLSDDMKCSINITNIKNEVLHIEESPIIDELTNESKKENEEIETVKEENYISDRDFEELEECSLDEDTLEIKARCRRKRKLHTDFNKWNCDKCERKYKSKTWLIIHLKTCQGKTKKIKYTKKKDISINDIFSCGLCDFTSDINLMKQHLDIHALSNDLNCGSCDFVGKDFACMVSHRYSHQPKNSKPKVFCHLCDSKIGSSISLQYHYRTVHLKKNGLDCTLCTKSFRTYKTWRNHEKWHRVDRYICDICGKKFLFRHAIEAHLIDHADFDKFICDTCGRGFKRLFNLRCHVNRRHVTHNPVKCSHCNKIFKSDISLQTHMRIVSKEKLFDCPVCPKKFPSEITMKNHLFWHTDERPFGCEVCGSKYKAKGQLKVHMRQHTGILPYKCQNCDKGFASTTQLKIHTSVHTGIRRHKCSFCPRTFHNRKLVESHCAAQHKDREMKLQIPFN